MIARLLGKIGLPLLIKFVSSGLANLNNEAAKKAGSALFDVDSAIQKQQISLDELKEANRHVEKSMELEAEVDEKTLETIHQTIRKELDSEDRFVRFWRPAFGYSVAFSWLMNMLTICYVVVSGNQNVPEIINALVETTSLWGIALGVLGISVVKNNKDNNVKTKLMSKII